jgi:hypothetical protein
MNTHNATNPRAVDPAIVFTSCELIAAQEYMDRSDHGCLTFPHRCNRTLKKRPTE